MRPKATELFEGGTGISARPTLVTIMMTNVTGLHSSCSLQNPSPDTGPTRAHSDLCGGLDRCEPFLGRGAEWGLERPGDCFTATQRWQGLGSRLGFWIPGPAFSPIPSVLAADVNNRYCQVGFSWISSFKQCQPRASFSICQRAWDLGAGLSIHLSAIHPTNKHLLNACLVPGLFSCWGCKFLSAECQGFWKAGGDAVGTEP